MNISIRIDSSRGIAAATRIAALRQRVIADVQERAAMVAVPIPVSVGAQPQATKG